MAGSLRRCAMGLIAGIAVSSGCFSDQPTASSGGTTGGACAIGSLGCDCTEGLGCDVGLECLHPSRMCARENCTPGEGMCSCDAMMGCEAGFVCVDDYCEAMAPGTTGSTTTVSTNATLPPQTSSTTSGATESAESATLTSGSAGSSTSSTGTGPSGACFDCLENVSMLSCTNPCTDCDELYKCFGRQRSDTCCEDSVPFSADPWNEFAICAGECEGVCGNLTCPSDGGVTTK